MKGTAISMRYVNKTKPKWLISYVAVSPPYTYPTHVKGLSTLHIPQKAHLQYSTEDNLLKHICIHGRKHDHKAYMEPFETSAFMKNTVCWKMMK